MEWLATVEDETGLGGDWFTQGWTPIAPNVLVPDRFRASGILDGFRVSMVIESDFGFVECVEVRVQGDARHQVTGEVLRSIPVKHLVKEATRQVLAESDDNGNLVFVGSSPTGQIPAEILAEWPSGRIDVFLRRVASVYRRAAAVGDPANMAVQEATGMSRATVGRVLREARTSGFLKPDEHAFSGGTRARRFKPGSGHEVASDE